MASAFFARRSVTSIDSTTATTPSYLKSTTTTTTTSSSSSSQYAASTSSATSTRPSTGSAKRDIASPSGRIPETDSLSSSMSNSYGSFMRSMYARGL
ncbi:hypothetical protein CLCR_02182 [Cladophialophora carrionii]|uniref:Uncharacterized protein n=1 Tax=Cladophialophora carrionii TaxID=86049 RepID=A0A1C1CDG1_9EURO|nr:hypothetical protein CLCR_02182 [Cladophialophora carrionii]